MKEKQTKNREQDGSYLETIIEETYRDFKQRQEERKPLELQWRLNMNFVAGNQYAEITASGDITDFGKYYFWQEREVYNHITPVVEARLAKLGRVKSKVSVRPFTNDEDDINTAKVSTQILNAVSHEIGLQDLTQKGSMWSEICGSVFYKVLWNSEKGRQLAITKDGRKVFEGEAEVVVCPPYEIYPDSLTREGIDDCASIIHAKSYLLEEIKEKWGVCVDAEDVSVMSLSNNLTLGGLGYVSNTGGFASETQGDSCIVIEKYVRPTKEFPQGRLIIVAGSQLIYDGVLPYQNGVCEERSFPFVGQETFKGAGAFFGTSVVERLIPLQRSYNAVKNRKHEYMNRIAMGVLAVEDGSVDLENLEDEGLSPGKILVYRQGASMPRMLNLGNVPNELTIEEERLLKEFLMISGVSEFSNYGRLPTSNLSGTALSIITEQDDARIAITAENIRSCIMGIGKQLLRLYRQFASSARLKRIAGASGELRLASFRANSLQSDDLVFDTENELNDTPANRKNMVMELVRLGLLQEVDGTFNPRTKLKLLELLGFGNWEDALDIDEMHRNKAIKENIEGGKFDLLEIDNHQIHIAEHTKAVLDNQDGTFEEKKKAILAHIKEHNAMVGEQVFKDIIKEDNYAE